MTGSPRVALVTGATSGIGRVTAVALARETSAEAGASESDPSDLPPFERHSTAMRKLLLRACNALSCLVSEAVSNSEQEAAWPCETQTVSFA